MRLPGSGPERLAMPRPARAVRAALVLALIAFAISTVPGVRSQPGFDPLLDGWLQGGAYVLAAVLCVQRVIAWRVERGVWAWFAAALSLRAAGFVLFLGYVRMLDPLPYPSVADACWLAMSLALFAGLLMLARAHSAGVEASLWLDGVVGALATAGVGLTLLGGTLDAVTAPGITDPVVLTDLAYPVTDLLLLLMILAVLVAFRWQPPSAVWLLGGGVAGFAIVDTVFLYQVTAGTYRPGTPLAALSMGATALIAFAGWRAPGRVVADRLGPVPGLAVPGIFALACVGQLVYASVSGAPDEAVALCAAGLVVAAASAMLTVDALRREREAVRAAKAEAERANAAKDVFLSRMSHELRTPLNAILGFGQLLELGRLDDDQRVSAEHITSAGRHLLALVDEVLDLSQVETGEMPLELEGVELAEALREAVELTAPLADARGIAFAADYGSGAVRADRRRLKQALLNLVGNAIKFSPEGATVRVRAAGRRVEIADDGPGIEPAMRDRVFVPFDRLGAERAGVEGTGLGLALTKGLVEAMGGAIGVDCPPGGGSTFWIELPGAADVEPTRARPTPETPAEVEPEPYAVLCIEDNEANRFLFERVLAQRPHVELIGVETGGEGIAAAREHAPALVLLDMNLPDLTGEEVLRRLREDPRTAALPVVVVSADATPDRIARLRALGADDYLTKPFEIAALLAIVDGVVTAARR